MQPILVLNYKTYEIISQLISNEFELDLNPLPDSEWKTDEFVISKVINFIKEKMNTNMFPKFHYTCEITSLIDDTNGSIIRSIKILPMNFNSRIKTTITKVTVIVE